MIIVISLPDFFDGETEQIVRLFEAGLQILHLRKPEATCEQTERLLQSLPATYLRRIVIHDHFDLALRYPLRGVHLNARNRVAPPGYRGLVSRSCHTLREVEQHQADCAYVFLSPIFNSISKTGYNSAFSIDELRQAATQGIIDDKVIALGGISVERIPLVRQIGFGGAALLGDIWQQPPEKQVEHFLQCIVDNG